MPDEQVTITKKEYDRLLKKSKILDALDMQGVDNWEGYDEAMRYLYKDEEI